MAHGVSFSECPVCHGTIGTRGMARHLAAHNGTASAKNITKKLPTLDRAALAMLRQPELAAKYSTTARRLVRLGYLTETHQVTEAGRARLS